MYTNQTPTQLPTYSKQMPITGTAIEPSKTRLTKGAIVPRQPLWLAHIAYRDYTHQDGMLLTLLAIYFYV